VTFATIELVYLAALVPLLVVAIQLADLRRQRTLMERLGELPAVKRMMAARSPARRIVKASLWGLGLGLVVFAAARPQTEGKSVTKRKGMDLVIALDVSKSMLVGDVEVGQPRGGWPEDMEASAPRPVPDEDVEWVQGNRLERGRQVITELAAELPDDRIAVVLYAGASIHFPMTDDENLAVQLAHLVGPTDLVGGSDIGEALRVGRCLLREQLATKPDRGDTRGGCGGIGERGHGGDPLPGDDRRSRRKRPRIEEKELEERGKALLVITDGGASNPSVVDEVDEAQKLGISMFFVGVGSEKGGVVPELGWDGEVIGSKRDPSGKEVHSSLDREGLRQLAGLAGGDGHYVEVPPLDEIDVTPIVTALNGVQRGELERVEHEKKRDIYQPFLFAGLMLLVIEAAIGLRRRVKHPEVRP
jgi:Ca-activated chloride channel family protein